MQTRPEMIIAPCKKGMFGPVNGLSPSWKQPRSYSSRIGSKPDMSYLFWSRVGFPIQNREALASRGNLAIDANLEEISRRREDYRRKAGRRCPNDPGFPSVHWPDTRNT